MKILTLLLFVSNIAIAKDYKIDQKVEMKNWEKGKYCYTTILYHYIDFKDNKPFKVWVGSLPECVDKKNASKSKTR